MPEDTKRSKGRPARETEPDKQYSFRLPADLIEQLDQIAEAESTRTGYRLDRVNIVRRALSEFVGRFPGNE